jgi:hypothetical protein
MSTQRLYAIPDLSSQEKDIMWLWNAEQLINPVRSKKQVAPPSRRTTPQRHHKTPPDQRHTTQ